MDKNVLIPVVLILVGIFLMTLPLTYTYISRFIEKIRMTPYDYYITNPSTGEKVTLEDILGNPERYPEDVVQNVYTLIRHYESLGLSREQIIERIKQPICFRMTRKLKLIPECSLFRQSFSWKVIPIENKRVYRCTAPIEIIQQPVDNDKGSNHFGYIYVQSAIRRIPDLSEKYGEKFYIKPFCTLLLTPNVQEVVYAWCICLPRYLIGTSLDEWYTVIEIPEQDLEWYRAEAITKTITIKVGPYAIWSGPYFAQLWQNVIAVSEPPMNETEASGEVTGAIEIRK